MKLSTRQTELLLTLIDERILSNTKIIADTEITQKLDDETTKLRGFTSELLQISDKLSKEANGGTK
jgi:hypothetical protein